MKDPKTLLKEAREAIKNKDFQSSLKLSKIILKEDKSNYMALVFLGLSVQEVGSISEAPQAFKKAIECNFENPLAWNGLINCYEKINSDEIKKDLVESYIAVLNIEINDRKIVEYSEKLSKLTQYGDQSKIIKTIHTCQKKFPERKFDLIDIIVELCEKFREKPSDIQHIHEECLLDSIKNTPTKSEYYISYITLVYNQERYEEAFKYAEKMYDAFPNDTSSLVWICKIYNKLFVEGNYLAENFHKVHKYYLNLLESDPKNAFALFTKGILFYKENKLIEAKDILVEVTASRPGLSHAWIFLTKLYVILNLFDEATQSVSRANKLLKSFNYTNTILKNILDELSLEFLSKSSNIENWQSAINLYDKIEDENVRTKAIKYIILANINLERFEKVTALMKDLEKINKTAARFCMAKLHRKKGEFQKALDSIEKDNVEDTEWWLEIGSLYWDLGEYQKCLIPFLKAAKCDPNNYLTYLALGNYYQKFEDLDKARRCYEKAFKIHPKSKEIGSELSKVYRKEKNWEASQNILQSLTTGSVNKKDSWAWFNLGLSFLEQGEYTKAIDNLQKAVRIETENPVPCWEALADAYLARGSYTSALKCYQICQELSDNKLYPSLQIANIQKILGEYTLAKTDFENILFVSGQYVPALKGLAETCICLAKQCFRDQRLGMARTHCQDAINKLGLAVQQQETFSCLWKLLGDVCLFVTKLPEKYSCLFILNTLLETEPLDKKTMMLKNDLFDLAINCYRKAISLSQENDLLWHDLGTCYLSQALNVDNPEKKEHFLNYALTTAQYCIELDSDNWQYWNLLGTIAMQQDPPNYALAQHAFIKAVSIDHNCAVSWTNLGTLYLLMDDIKLANKAFAQGQRSDPNYVHCWIGQAMIAEIMGHEEAMDLFRHSTQLSQHQQGGIGYGYWVCKTLLETPLNTNIYCIHNMHAIPVACDALTWYTEKNPQDGCAWNMLGILRERMGLKESTLQAFKNAYRLCRKEHRDLARVNYGRILSKLGKYSEAINIFQEVQEATFNSGSGLALALFNDKQYEGSYSAYEQALHWLTEEQSSQSDLLVALASMAYMFQGSDTAKTLLFQSIQLKPASPWGLYATLSLALLHQDMTLAQLILNELKTLKDDHQCLPHYAILLSYVYSLQEQYKQAVTEISKLIHRHPNNASVWLTLCHSLLAVRNQQKCSLAPAKCAQTAIKLGRSSMDVTKVLSLASLAFMLVGEQKQAIISAQKAVHSYPNVTTGWAVLCWALANNKSSVYPKKTLKDISCHIKNLNPTDSILRWTKNFDNYIK